MFQDECMNCMTVIVGKGISDTGRVLVAHNEDDPEHVIVRRAIVPVAEHAVDETVPAEQGLARIPQAAKTLRYYWVEYVKDRGGLTSADAFLNEKGVVITSNSMGWSKEDSDDPSVVKDGGIGYALRRILAERAESARDAARILMELMDEWGYAPSGRAYTIADKDEAFMFQLVRGHHYVGARVPDDAVAVMPNHYTFHTLHDCPEMFYSQDIVTYAIKKGWYEPKTEDYSDFDFAEVYQDERTWKNAGNMFRQKHGQRIVLNRDWDIEKEGTPFVVYPAEPIGLKTLSRVMRCHYEGTPDDIDQYGPGRSPHYVPTMRRICTGTTLESDLWDLTDQAENTCVYTAIGRPCQVPYLPLHPLLGVPECLLSGEDGAEMMRTHLQPHPGVTAVKDDLNTRLRRLCGVQEMLHSDVAEKTGVVLDGILEKAFAENAHAQDQPARAKELDEAFLNSTLEEMEKLSAEFNVVPVDCVRDIVLPNCGSITVTFTLPAVPVEAELRFGLEFTHTINAFASAREGSLRSVGKDTYQAEFEFEKILPLLTDSGRHTFWLGGRTEAGAAFAGCADIDVAVTAKTE